MSSNPQIYRFHGIIYHILLHKGAFRMNEEGYKELIIDMVKKIENKEILIKIYTVVKTLFG